jgi:4-diphosphocytidyl-2-C-methyl-D-erythritol kinase
MDSNLDKAWPAPAKLNLMLRIVGRRGDGYHLLQTVFQFLDVADMLRFQLRPDGEIRRATSLPGVAEAQDLVVRAAQLLQREAAVAWGADISLDKRLPMGGGLGGGSSDAATTLVALNQLWQAGLGVDALADLGLQLGADVPVFVRGHAAWAEGVGESLTPIDLPEPWYLVLVPPCHVSTAEVFADPELTRDSPRITIPDFLAGRVENDCLEVVSRRYPAVAKAMEWLGQYARPRLTGTGGCVFAAFEDETAARQVLQRMPQGYQGLVARGMNRSLLLTAATGR